MRNIQIDTKAHIIDLDKKPIRDSYTAEEIAGGVHGAVRLKRCAILDSLVFGRIAGPKCSGWKTLG